MARYQVVDGSVSAHCCFEATVWDTSKPEMIGGKHYHDYAGRPQYETVCECFSREDAERVANALNKGD